MLLCAPLAILAAGDAIGPFTFEEIANRAGVHFVTDNGANARKQQPAGLTAGVAVFDYDGDGYPDLYFINGASLPSLVKTGPQFSNRLYRNNHDLTFTDVTAQAGLAGAGYGMGVAIGDYDNDGRPDIYVTNVNGNQLFHNNGNGTFTDVTRRAGVAGGRFEGKKMWSAAAAWVDYNNDGLLDLFVSNYCQWDPATEPACKTGNQLLYCSPRHYKPLPNTLFRNNGNGTFTDVSAETGIAANLGRGMGVAVADYDGDGFPDIFVANDDAPFQLFHNLAGKRFEEVALKSGAAYPESGNAISGMGVDFRDVFNTGLPSLWVTAIEKETFPLLANLGRGEFADQTAAAGLAAETYQMSGWSNAIVDLDNDGWKDLAVVRSNVQDNIALLAPRSYEEPIALFRNLGTGKFQNASGRSRPRYPKAGSPSRPCRWRPRQRRPHGSGRVRTQRTRPHLPQHVP